jgi:uncharacterized protein (TIGR03435 family)
MAAEYHGRGWERRKLSEGLVSESQLRQFKDDPKGCHKSAPADVCILEEDRIIRPLTIGVALAIVACAGFGQTPERPTTFEVASIKRAIPPRDGDGKGVIRIGAQGGPGTRDPGRISYSFVSLRMLLAQAFGLKNQQVSGPDWLDSARFNIVAKTPIGATKDDLPVMLQNLLKERFHLAFHRENKELPAYALVTKGQRKLTESASQSDPAAAQPSSENGGGQTAAPAGPPDLSRFKVGKDGMPELPPGAQRPGILMMAMMSPTGPRTMLRGKQQTMAQLADNLSNLLDRPVVDMAGLTSRYDFALVFVPDPSVMNAKMGTFGKGPVPGASEPGGSGGNGGALTGALESDDATIFVAIQQLGLKLDAKKLPVDLLVVDHMERTPSEN